MKLNRIRSLVLAGALLGASTSMTFAQVITPAPAPVVQEQDDGFDWGLLGLLGLLGLGGLTGRKHDRDVRTTTTPR